MLSQICDESKRINEQTNDTLYIPLASAIVCQDM